MPAAEDTADHVPRALRAHHGRHRLRDPQRPEEVGLDDLARLGLGGLLDRAVQAVAGVVDEHIDATEVLVARARPRRTRLRDRRRRARRASAFGDAARSRQPSASRAASATASPALERRASRTRGQPAGRARDQPHPHRAR